MTIYDERGKRFVPAQDLIESISHGSRLRRVELMLRERWRIAGRKEEVITVAQWHVEPLGKVENHLGTGTRAAGLDEAEMT